MKELRFISCYQPDRLNPHLSYKPNGKEDTLALEETLAMDNVFVYIYTKEITKPGGKTWPYHHVNHEKQELIQIANQIKQLHLV